MQKKKWNMMTIRMACILLLLAAGQAFAMELGPLQTTNRLPLYMMFLTPRPTKAQLPDPGRLETSLAVEYNSVFLEESSDRWNVLMDMEMTVLDFSLVYGLSRRMALKVDLPFVSMSNGFLDGFLESYHDALGVPNAGRDNRPENVFAYRIIKDGELWFEGETGTLRPTDMTLSAQYQLGSVSSGRGTRSSALMLSLKLPTGDTDQGLGSGELDVGVYVPIQWSGNPWSFYLMPGFALINDPDSRQAEIGADNSFSLFIGTAYDYSERLRLLAQLNFHTSPVEETEISDLDDGALELSLGFQRRFKEHMALEFAFSEDLTRAAPDFNIRLGWIWAFSMGGS